MSSSRTGLSDLLSRVAVSVGGDSVQTIDLVLLGVLNAEWAEFELRVARGLAFERAHGEAVTESEVRAEATLFRYARGLISAAEYRQWLEQRRLTTGDVSGVLRRLLLRRRFDASADPEPDSDGVVRVVRAESLCDGILARLADKATGLLAAGQLSPATGDPSAADAERATHAVSVACSLPVLGLAARKPGEIERRASRLLSLELSARYLRRTTGQSAAVANRIRDHALDWSQLRGWRLTFELEGAAREARLLLRDGESPEQVGERAGSPVLEDNVLVRDAPPGLDGFFASAVAGEVLGPWEQNGHWHVMQVLSKLSPSSEDAPTRERAIDELWSEAVDRHAAGRTTRHVAL